MNETYYHDSGIATILTSEGIEIVEKMIVGRRCKECGGKLGVYVSVDTSCIVCGVDNYHTVGVSIDMDNFKHNKLPKLSINDI